MLSKSEYIQTAMDTYAHNPDIIPNSYNTFAIDGREMTPYLSPTGLVLVGHFMRQNYALEEACVHIMDSCDFVNPREIFDFAEDTLWGSGNNERQLNPLELALLDMAYFGDHDDSPNIAHLIEWYDPKVVNVSKKYDEICQRLYQAANDWQPCTVPHDERIEVILQLALDWYNKFNVPLDCQWFLNYVPRNFDAALSNLMLYRDDG